MGTAPVPVETTTTSSLVTTQRSTTTKKMVTTQAPCSAALGMESGLIRDDQITPSSTNDDSTMTSSSYRIITTSFNPDENQPWSPAQEDTTPYMEVDFDEPTEITGVATQGRVVSYTVQYQQGQDDVWQTMTVKRADPVTGELNDTPVVFEGSNNDMEIVKTRIMTVFVVSKIRVYPTASSDVTMRLELYGCGKGPVSTTTTPM